MSWPQLNDLPAKYSLFTHNLAHSHVAGYADLCYMQMERNRNPALPSERYVDQPLNCENPVQLWFKSSSVIVQFWVKSRIRFNRRLFWPCLFRLMSRAAGQAPSPDMAHQLEPDLTHWPHAFPGEELFLHVDILPRQWGNSVSWREKLLELMRTTFGFIILSFVCQSLLSVCLPIYRSWWWV